MNSSTAFFKSSLISFGLDLSSMARSVREWRVLPAILSAAGDYGPISNHRS
jgi:hypothetical protein